MELTSTNDELAEMSPATLQKHDIGAGICDMFSEDEEELQVAPTEDQIPKGFEAQVKEDLPDVADYDAAAVPQLRPCDVPAATRQSATCEACLQTRLGRRKTRPHSLVWGECLRALRPIAEEVTAAEE